MRPCETREMDERVIAVGVPRGNAQVWAVVGSALIIVSWLRLVSGALTVLGIQHESIGDQLAYFGQYTAGGVALLLLGAALVARLAPSESRALVFVRGAVVPGALIVAVTAFVGMWHFIALHAHVPDPNSTAVVSLSVDSPFPWRYRVAEIIELSTAVIFSATALWLVRGRRGETDSM
jgi:hypothetical protein